VGRGARIADVLGDAAPMRGRGRNTTMPYVNVQVTAGLSRRDKEALVGEFTDTLVRVLGKRPEHIHIVIQEIAEENWGFVGMLTDTYRASTGVLSAPGADHGGD
jgi:4-oxalocrotonate tautomerase